MHNRSVFTWIKKKKWKKDRPEAFVWIAAEIYAMIGKYCKEASPYRKTMIVTRVDRRVGYIIDKTSVNHRCFEHSALHMKKSFCVIEPGTYFSMY